jgi:hypothetical protein
MRRSAVWGDPFATTLYGMLSLMALVASIGLYGVTAHGVSQRTRDRHPRGVGSDTLPRHFDGRQAIFTADCHRLDRWAHRSDSDRDRGAPGSPDLWFNV